MSIYDNFRNELISKSPELLQLCHERSNKICLRTYSKPTFDPNSYKRLLRGKSYSKKISMTHKQINALKLLFEWRDNLARKLDKSCEYLLENQCLFKIGHELPQTIKEIPFNKNVHKIVEHKAHEIIEIISRAKNFSEKK